MTSKQTLSEVLCCGKPRNHQPSTQHSSVSCSHAIKTAGRRVTDVWIHMYPPSGPLAPVSLSTLCFLPAHLLQDPTSRPRGLGTHSSYCQNTFCSHFTCQLCKLRSSHHFVKRAVEPKSSSVGEDLPDNFIFCPEELKYLSRATS